MRPSRPRKLRHGRMDSFVRVRRRAAPAVYGSLFSTRSQPASAEEAKDDTRRCEDGSSRNPHAPTGAARHNILANMNRRIVLYHIPSASLIRLHRQAEAAVEVFNAHLGMAVNTHYRGGAFWPLRAEARVATTHPHHDDGRPYRPPIPPRVEAQAPRDSLQGSPVCLRRAFRLSAPWMEAVWQSVFVTLTPLRFQPRYADTEACRSVAHPTLHAQMHTCTCPLCWDPTTHTFAPQNVVGAFVRDPTAQERTLRIVSQHAYRKRRKEEGGRLRGTTAVTHGDIRMWSTTRDVAILDTTGTLHMCTPLPFAPTREDEGGNDAAAIGRIVRMETPMTIRHKGADGEHELALRHVRLPPFLTWDEFVA